MSVQRRTYGDRTEGRALSQYDLLLAVLPVPLLTGVVVALTGTLSLPLGVSLGSGLSALVLGYAMFVVPPSGPKPVRTDQ